MQIANVGDPLQRDWQADIAAEPSQAVSQAGFAQMPGSEVPSVKETTAPISTSFDDPSLFFNDRRKFAYDATGSSASGPVYVGRPWMAHSSTMFPVDGSFTSIARRCAGSEQSSESVKNPTTTLA